MVTAAQVLRKAGDVTIETTAGDLCDARQLLRVLLRGRRVPAGAFANIVRVVTVLDATSAAARGRRGPRQFALGLEDALMVGMTLRSLARSTDVAAFTATTPQYAGFFGVGKITRALAAFTRLGDEMVARARAGAANVGVPEAATP